VSLNKGKENEIQFNVKQMLNEPHVSMANEEVEWFPEPFFQEEHVSGIIYLDFHSTKRAL